MLKKLKKLWVIVRFFFEDEKNLFLHLMEMKVQECLRDCEKLSVGEVEELEDMLFHIKSYYDIPKVIAELKYPQFKDVTIREISSSYKKGERDLREAEEYADYLVDVETQRAVEREFIFEHAKILSFGFEL